jgi:hypothetical protein
MVACVLRAAVRLPFAFWKNYRVLKYPRGPYLAQANKVLAYASNVSGARTGVFFTAMTNKEFLAELDALDFDVVKERIATNVYLPPESDIAKRWLERKEAALVAEQIALALQAQKVAQLAARIALAAFVIAAISLIVAVFK